MANLFIDAFMKAGNKPGFRDKWLSDQDSANLDDYVGFDESDFEYDPDYHGTEKEYKKFLEEERDEKIQDYFEDKSQEFLADFSQAAKVNGDKIKIYRCVTVKDSQKYADDLGRGKYPKGFSGLGIFWSWNFEAAECHWGKSENPDIVYLIGEVPLSAVDVTTTLIKNLHTSLGEEKEIQLKEGAKITLISVATDHGPVSEYNPPLKLKAEQTEAATSEIYYHGTSSEFAKEILSKGLLPEPPKRAWDEGTSLESFPGVYLTTNILSAIQAAGASIKKYGGHPVVFEVQVEKKTGLLDEDELPGLLTSLDKANNFLLNEYYAKQFMDPKADEATKKWEEEYLLKGTEFYLARLKDYIGHELHEEEKKRLRPLIKDWGRAWIKQIALTHRDEQKKIPEFRTAMDKVIRALKILPKMEWKTNIRITNPIGFRGANKILSATAFVNYPRPETDEAYILKPLYGKPSQKMVDAFQARMGGKIQVTSSNKKEELKKKYGEKKENTYLYYPVTINGDDDYHLTVKFLGICSATKEEILKAMEGIDKTPPEEFQWRPIEWDSKNDGKVKVLELLGVPENLVDLHDSLEEFREDEYDEYRPHITVEDDLWEKIKRDNIDPSKALVQVGPLSIDIRGERFYLVKDKKAEAAGWYSWEPEPIYDHQPSELPAQNTGGPFQGAPGDTFIKQEDEFDVRLNKDGINAKAETYEDEGHVGKHWGSQASGIMFVSDGKVLLLQRADWTMDPGLWGIAGGAVPVDKSGQPLDVKKSAINEVTEEMGGMPPHTDTGKSIVFSSDDGFKYTTFLFEVPETFEPILNSEHERSQWFPLNELPKEIHPGVMWALQNLGLVTASVVEAKAYWTFMTNRDKEAEIYLNPSPREIQKMKGEYSQIRALLDGDKIFMWDAYQAIHFQVWEELKKANLIGPDPISLDMYFNGTKVAEVMVTDFTEKTKWHHDPKLKEIILNNPTIKRIAEPDMNVSYYDEAIVGPWEEQGQNSKEMESKFLPELSDLLVGLKSYANCRGRCTHYAEVIGEIFRRAGYKVNLLDLTVDDQNHTVTLINGNWVIDFTLNQFRKDAPVPYVVQLNSKKFNDNYVMDLDPKVAVKPFKVEPTSLKEADDLWKKLKSKGVVAAAKIEGAKIPLKKFMDAVERVADTANFAFPENAYWQCSDFSNAVALMAQELLLPVELYSAEVTFKDSIKEVEAGDIISHRFLKVGDNFVDFTARQADSQAEFPYIFKNDPSYQDIKKQSIPAELDDGSAFWHEKLAVALGLKSKTEGASKMESFLPENLVMIDGEFTNVNPKRDHLLQVAMLKLGLKNGQYEEIDEPLVLYMDYKGQPDRDFHREHLAHIFERCNESNLQPGEAKEQICKWLGDLKGKVQPVGDCVHKDMAFLIEKGLVDDSDISIEGDPIPGTFHYENFEMHPIKSLARYKHGSKREVAGMDKENEHDALVDCRNQLLELNDSIKVLVPDMMAPERLTHESPANPVNSEVKPQKSGTKYPTVSWIRDALNQFGFTLDFEEAYVAGSIAKGTETEESDLDIILPLITVDTHLDILNDDLVNVMGGELEWNGRPVDFKAVMVDELENKNWDLIELKAAYVAESATKELPEPLRPVTRDDRSLPDSTEAQMKSFEGKALRADSFQEFQELLSTILVKLELTEDYRKSVAGIMNQFRERKGYVAL
jgi:oligoribonuclease (3'-5' exoribonuclease)/8-oxo-dGTP pyrophosphatase MutT (NUDIX family)